MTAQPEERSQPRQTNEPDACTDDRREAASPRFSIQLLLPEDENRRLRKWTDRTAGASWPEWGGHVTLVPSFTTSAGVTAVRAQAAAVCADYDTFTIDFGQAVAVKDWTRPQFQAVFLTCVDEAIPGYQEMLRLRQELDGLDLPDRQELRPELRQQTLKPHVTLALGLADVEAASLVKEVRMAGLHVELVIDAVWLMVAAADDPKMERLQRIALPLGAGGVARN